MAQSQNKYFALTYTTGDRWDRSLATDEQPYFKEHSRHLTELRKTGKIALGARYADIGLIILNVKDENEARDIVAQDISVKNGTFKASLHAFNTFYPGSVGLDDSQEADSETPMNTAQNFQIPVDDFDRAHRFYSTVMGYELVRMEHQGASLGIFRFNGQQGGAGGMLIKSEGLSPSKTGTMVYLDTGKDLQPYLERVTVGKGSVVIEKTSLGPDMGYFAIFDDTEGNRVGLYSKE